MGARRLNALLVLAACSATPKTPRPEARTASAPAPTSTSASGAPATTPAPPPVPSAPAAPASNTTLAEAGIEASSLDRTVDPCVDFYQFACGGWLASTKLPPDKAQWSRFGEVEQKNQLALRALLDDAAKTPGPLGDFYTSCMDEAGVEKAGTAGIKPLLAAVQSVKDAKSWLAAVEQLHGIGISVVWGATADADVKDPAKNVTMLDADGLGLPDRDYYLKAELADVLRGYTRHVSRMLALGGIAGADAAAADVVAIESALAALTKTQADKRDVPSMYNPTDLKGLAKQVKSVDWKAYFKALGVVPSSRIVVGTPKYFAALDGLRKQFKPAQWSAYFTYHLLVRTSFALPKAFDDEAFALEQQVTGVTTRPERFKRCVEATQLALGEVLGKAYVDKQFPEKAKQTASALVDAIIAVMSDELGAEAWLAESTRKTAQGKLAKLVRMVGYPEHWRTYDFAIKRDDFAGNRLRASAFEVKRVLSKAGKPVDRGEWLMNTFEVNAYYNAPTNNAALLAGILQPPFFGADRAFAVNMGAIGMVIGHELTHAFDDQGAQFDATGKLASWWTPADSKAFEERGTCVSEQYATYEAAPKQYVNGALTLGENIADLGGVKMAFRTYKKMRMGAGGALVADGFTEDQMFFLGAAQAWCTKTRPAEVQRRLTIDPHAPDNFRVFGMMRNLPEFAQAFSCAAGTPMHPAQTCTVW